MKTLLLRLRYFACPFLLLLGLPTLAEIDVDPGFVPQLGHGEPSITAIARQPNGAVLVAGRFHAPDFEGIIRLHPNGDRDETFASPSIPSVLQLALQSDGRFLVAGAFTVDSNVSRQGIVRLLPDGTLDESFLPPVAGPMSQVLAEADGRILLKSLSAEGTNRVLRLNWNGSSHQAFYEVEQLKFVQALAPAVDGGFWVAGIADLNGQAVGRLLRFGADGFQVPWAPPLDGVIAFQGIAAYPDRRLLLQATVGNDPAVDRNETLRFRPDGSLDSSFAAEGVSLAPAIIQAGGKLVGGSPLRRLNVDGALDATFPSVDLLRSGGGVAGLKALLLEPNGDLLIAGDFATVAGIARNGLARITNDAQSAAGSLEFTAPFVEINEQHDRQITLAVQRVGGSAGPVSARFASIPESASDESDFLPVNGRVEFADGESGEKLIELFILHNRMVEPDKTFVVALADPLGGATLGGIARSLQVIRDNDINLFVDPVGVQVPEHAGFVDVTIRRTGQSHPVAFQIQTVPLTARSGDDFEPTFLWAGFEAYEWELTIRIPIRNDPWPEPDEEFELQLLDRPGYDVVVEPNRTRIKIVDDDRPGGADPRFDPGSGPSRSGGTGASLRAFHIQTDGRIVVGGVFSEFSGVSGNSLARLLPDGSLDPDFNVGTGAGFGDTIPDEPGGVWSLAAQADGKLLVGGYFWTFDGHSRTGLARLNPEGSLDTSFELRSGFLNDTSDESVNAIVVQPDGRILVAWSRRQPNVTGGPPLFGLARLLAGGERDPSFGDNGLVLVEPHGTQVFGRFFTEGIQALALQADGKLLVGGQFLGIQGTPARGIARLLPDGSVDPSFHIGSGTLSPYDANDPGKVRAIKILGNGKIMVGGYFDWMNDRPMPSLALLNADGTIDPSFQSQIGRWSYDLGSPTFDNINSLTGVSDLAAQLDIAMTIAVGQFFELDRSGRPGPATGEGLSLARFYRDGTLDRQFDSYIVPRKVAVHTDNAIYVIGDFPGGIARLNGDPPFRVRSITRPNAARVRMVINVPVDHDYLLMRSTNLVTWRPQQILELTKGTHEIEIAAPVGAAQGYFQVMAVSP